MTWIKDKNGNRCSVEYWGSEKKAKEALASLKDCSDCSDCSRCSRCSYCSGCSDCSDKYEVRDSMSIPTFKTIPIVKNLHQKIYAAASQPEALRMSNWHTCEKTHCRAGWVVTLAGSEGKELEQFFNTELAAMMIYDASCPGYKINPARFFDNNEAALADMKKLAEE